VDSRILGAFAPKIHKGSENLYEVSTQSRKGAEKCSSELNPKSLRLGVFAPRIHREIASGYDVSTQWHQDTEKGSFGVNS
jgi:hypothetical protein